MVQGGGRIVCPQCGANNFDTVATCYKCAAPLGQQNQMPSRPPVSMTGPRTPSSLPSERALPPLNPMNQGLSAAAYPPPSYPPGGYGGGGGDPKVARRAAILLALTIPFIGLPVGWAFMMIEDQKRQAIGRLCVNWSLIALVFHLLLTFVFMQSLSSYLPMALKIMQATATRGQSGESGLPGQP